MVVALSFIEGAEAKIAGLCKRKVTKSPKICNRVFKCDSKKFIKFVSKATILYRNGSNLHKISTSTALLKVK